MTRAAATGIALAVVFCLVVLNLRLYPPARLETTLAQLRFIRHSLDEGAAERMQSLFPEGYLFTWALYGLASANVARSLPPSDPRRVEALRAGREAITHLDSQAARGTFVADMTPRYGAFYTSWSLYLRSAVLRASGPSDPEPFDRKQFDADCDSLALALASSDTPFLDSYPGAAWPVDTAVGVAALAIADPYLGHRHRATIARWFAQARARRDLRTGALPHTASGNGPRGGSLAMLSYVLADADPVFAMQQYGALRQHFVEYRWGIPAVREYPHGVDGASDVDSGPLILGFSGPASVLGAGAAFANGDQALGAILLGTIEAVGLPLEMNGERRYAFGYLPVGDAFLAWVRSTPARAEGMPYAPLVPGWWRLLIHLVSVVLAGAVVAIAKIVGRKSFGL